jgi:hypothetical protein
VRTLLIIFGACLLINILFVVIMIPPEGPVSPLPIEGPALSCGYRFGLTTIDSTSIRPSRFAM